MKIKIEKSVKCVGALAAANAGADAHTYDVSALLAVAGRAEAQLDALGLTQAQRAGAVVHCVSGGTVPSGYKYRRALTRATLTRTSGGWWLTSAARLDAWEGHETLYLTESQDDAAVAHLRKGYRRG